MRTETVPIALTITTKGRLRGQAPGGRPAIESAGQVPSCSRASFFGTTMHQASVTSSRISAPLSSPMRATTQW